MPRQILGTLTKGQLHVFGAAAQNDGTVNVEFPTNAKPQDTTSIEVTYGPGTTVRRSHLIPDSNGPARMGPYTGITSIKNIGPSRVQVSLSY